MTIYKTFHIAVVIAATLALPVAGPALAQSKDTLTIGLTLEPPHIDPTAGAAAVIDEIVYIRDCGPSGSDEGGAEG